MAENAVDEGGLRLGPFLLSIVLAVFFFCVNWAFVDYFSDALGRVRKSEYAVMYSLLFILSFFVLEGVTGFACGWCKRKVPTLSFGLIVTAMFIGTLYPMLGMYDYTVGQIGMATVLVSLVFGLMLAQPVSRHQ